MTCPRTYATSDFDFDLPPQLIAQHPAATRSASRLLDGTGTAPADRRFADLPGLLCEGDLLVLNDTQVVKARLFGEKPSGGKLELLVERVLADGTVAAHMRASKKPPVGTRLRMAGGTEQGGFEAELLGRWPQADGALFHLRFSGDAYALMAAHGHVPLPPYITHADGAEDEARYQTVFAARPGAVAAPTASLHFDEAVLQALAARGDAARELMPGMAWQNAAGNVLGVYLHGLFEDPAVLRALFGARARPLDEVFERLAAVAADSFAPGFLQELIQEP